MKKEFCQKATAGGASPALCLLLLFSLLLSYVAIGAAEVPRTLVAGDYDLTVTHAGRARTYLLHVPSQGRAGAPSIFATRCFTIPIK
ncbi:MAG: hypothetical protein AB7G75_32635 [Candidatus Binatia bacterium]